jgi:hypothetical protein
MSIKPVYADSAGVTLHFCCNLKIRNCGNVKKSFKINHARVAELADALALGASG